MSERDHRSLVDVPSAVLGFGTALLLLSAVWLYYAGIRVDEQGTTTTAFEDAGLWGGLAIGLALTISGVVLTRRR